MEKYSKNNKNTEKLGIIEIYKHGGGKLIWVSFSNLVVAESLFNGFASFYGSWTFIKDA